MSAAGVFRERPRPFLERSGFFMPNRLIGPGAGERGFGFKELLEKQPPVCSDRAET